MCAGRKNPRFERDFRENFEAATDVAVRPKEGTAAPVPKTEMEEEEELSDYRANCGECARLMTHRPRR